MIDFVVSTARASKIFLNCYYFLDTNYFNTYSKIDFLKSLASSTIISKNISGARAYEVKTPNFVNVLRVLLVLEINSTFLEYKKSKQSLFQSCFYFKVNIFGEINKETSLESGTKFLKK